MALTETGVAVVLLTKTTDCLFLPGKIENTSTLVAFNLHCRKTNCFSCAPSLGLLSSVVVIYLVESVEFGSNSSLLLFFFLTLSLTAYSP